MVGRCYHQITPFVEIYRGQLLSVPNMSAYICDVCHFAEFELNEIESIWAELGMDNDIDDFQSSSESTYSSPFGK